MIFGVHNRNHTTVKAVNFQKEYRSISNKLHIPFSKCLLSLVPINNNNYVVIEQSTSCNRGNVHQIQAHSYSSQYNIWEFFIIDTCKPIFKICTFAHVLFSCYRKGDAFHNFRNYLIN